MKALASNLDYADELMRKAVGHHQAGRLAEAEKTYHEVLAFDPQQGDALRLLGGVYLQAEQNEKALDTLRRASRLRPEDAEIPNNIGIALRNLGRIDEAISSFEQALRLKPDYAEAFNNLGHAFHSRGWPAIAITIYERALQIKPDYIRAVCNMAAALRDTGRDSEAESQLMRMLKKHQQHPDLLYEYGVTLQKQHKLLEATQAYDQSLRSRPNHFTTLCNLGSVLRDLNRIDEALKHYESALKVAPNRPEIFVNLGAVFWDMNCLERAIACYEQALKLQPDNVDALVNFGTVLWASGKTAEARKAYHHALHIKPDCASAYSNLGSLHQDEADLDAALNDYDKALRIDPMHPEARFGRSMALLAYGQYREGWMLYETGLGKRLLRGLNQFPTKPWNGLAAPDKRLLIWSEQGLGDSLQFIRYAQLCHERVEKVIVLCPKPLVRLFQSCPSVDEVCTTIQTGNFDEHVAMMSLPYVFGTTLETVPPPMPYLHVPPESAAKMAGIFDGLSGIKAGLVWAGNAREGQVNANMLDRRRSLHLKQLMPLFEIPNLQLVNLQLGAPRKQITELGLQDKILDVMDRVEDFADTAAIVHQLDLVISVDTSVAHLAGGLGKPVWILSRYDACWRWLRNRKDNPWYPTARVFGQSTKGDWSSVLENVVRELKNLAQKTNFP